MWHFFFVTFLTISFTTGHDVHNGHADGAVNAHENGHVHTNGVNGDSNKEKPSLRLSFAEYKRISNLIVLHLRHAEEGENFNTHEVEIHTYSTMFPLARQSKNTKNWV